MFFWVISGNFESFENAKFGELSLLTDGTNDLTEPSNDFFLGVSPAAAFETAASILLES